MDFENDIWRRVSSLTRRDDDAESLDGCHPRRLLDRMCIGESNMYKEPAGDLPSTAMVFLRTVCRCHHQPKPMQGKGPLCSAGPGKWGPSTTTTATAACTNLSA